MKKVKYIIYGTLGMVIILLITAVFLPKEYEFQCKSKIDVSQPVVYNLLANLENRVHWDPISSWYDVILNDANGVNEFEWESEAKGNGRIESLSNQNQSDLILNKYKGDNEIPEVIKYSLKSDEENVTDISIDYKGSQSWPFNLFNIITTRKKAKLLKAELSAVEKIAKARHTNNQYNGYIIIEGVVKEKNFITKRDKVSLATVQQFYIQNLGVLFKDVQAAGLEMDGMPSGLFYSTIKNAAILGTRFQ